MENNVQYSMLFPEPKNRNFGYLPDPSLPLAEAKIKNNDVIRLVINGVVGDIFGISIS